MRHTAVHKLLVILDRLNAVPSLGIMFVIVLLAALIYVVWHGRDQVRDVLLVTLAFASTCLADWLLLWLLPRAGRSYGPDRPTTLVLVVVRGVLVALLGVLLLPWWSAAALSVAITMIVFDATWIEPFRLGVTHQRYTFPHWRPDAPPLRLLHITDLHVERVTARERHMNALVDSLQPDVIVFSGDFTNLSYIYDPKTKAHIREVIGDWSAPMGVYCVPGTYTVEPLSRVREFVAGLENLRLLEDEWVVLDAQGGQLNLLGMVTTHILECDRETVKGLMKAAPESGLTLLLTHAPDVAPEAAAAGYDLYLCGHTHGGQLRLPVIGALFSGSALGKRFVMGRYELGGMTLYTSRGVGMEGMGAPRARFLCPPEIVLWEIGGPESS